VVMLTRYYPTLQCLYLMERGLIGVEGGSSSSRNDLAGPNSLVRTGERLTWDYRSVHHCTSLGNFDDIFVHRPEDGEQLALFFRRHVEGIQGTDQVLYQCIEGGSGDLHTFVGRLHVST